MECFAAGLGGSRAPLTHLLAAGVEATPGWADAALERFNCGDVAAVAPLVVDRQQPQKVLSAGLRYTRSGSIRHLAAGRRLDRFKTAERLLCGPVLECSFYRREALASVVSLPNFPSARAAAVELGLAVIAAGYRCVQAPECLTTAYGELFSHRGGWREGVAGERLFRRWAMLPDGKRSRLGHAVVVAMECVQAPLRPSLLGRLAGRCWAALGLGGTGEIALAAEATAQQPGSLSRPSPYAAAQSRAA